MLLRNYFVVYSAQTTGNPNDLNFVDTGGTSRKASKTVHNSYYKYLSTSLNFESLEQVNTNGAFSNPGVYFGDGSAVSKEDYKLSGSCISGISVSVVDSSENSEECFIARKVYTITNGNSAAITISEIGYVGSCIFGSNTVAGALLEHTVLESPITIEPGGVGQVTYEIKMNYPI